jgi:hypothetical protein
MPEDETAASPYGDGCGSLVGARGFEPPTSRARSVRAAGLRHAPSVIGIIPQVRGFDKSVSMDAP